MASFNTHAANFNFSYTFANNSILEGSLDGTLQANNDTVFVNSFGPVSYAGTLLNTIDANELSSASDFRIGALQPIVSFSGNLMDILVCPQGFISGHCDAAINSGFYFDTSVFSAGAAEGLGDYVFESYRTQNFSSTSPSSFPVPAALPLMASALGVFGIARRRNKLKLA